MNLQPNYGSAPATGLPGMVANEEKCNKVSRTVENAAGIAFGQPAYKGAGDHGVVATANAVFEGIAVQTPASFPTAAQAASAAGPDAYHQFATGAFLTLGVIWVVAGAAVAKGDPVFHVPGTGRYGTTAGGGNAIPDAYFESAAVNGSLVKIAVGLRRRA